MVIVACMIWGRRRGVKTPLAVVFGFAVLACLFAFMYIREAESIGNLKHLDRSTVQVISYKGRDYRNPRQVGEVVSAFHQTQWYTVKGSDMVDPQILLIGFTDGRQWEMTVGRSRYGEGGVILRLATEHEFTRGVAFNSILGEVLTSIGSARGPLP